MYIIAGLGNPTFQYAMTRHNVGFRAVEELAERNGISLSSNKYKAISGSGIICGQKAVLVLPQTYMNLSGDAIIDFVNFYKIDVAANLIVIYDDIDLDVGRLRIRTKGSAGGHNGIKNIIMRLGTMEFPRVRIGVGAKPEGWDLADYVLSKFGENESAAINDGIEEAAKAVECILKNGIDAAMNQYNKKKEP